MRAGERNRAEELTVKKRNPRLALLNLAQPCGNSRRYAGTAQPYEGGRDSHLRNQRCVPRRGTRPRNSQPRASARPRGSESVGRLPESARESSPDRACARSRGDANNAATRQWRTPDGHEQQGHDSGGTRQRDDQGPGRKGSNVPSGPKKPEQAAFALQAPPHATGKLRAAGEGFALERSPWSCACN